VVCATWLGQHEHWYVVVDIHDVGVPQSHPVDISNCE
jgi:hypothetical protein